ncbi:exopolysaccharide biosynthesis protein [Paracoccus angustae]|uniref:Exopolysaccharide biosynthesis protein n=1 Tax=Paracoccus angustae TaxID=1671480 RepID=A0ABV7U2X0_9RHOB
MAQDRSHKLSEVLDQLEDAAHGDSITVRQVVEKLGQKSFASLILIFALVAVSPASAIPGLTSMVAAIVFILMVQMIFGRDSVWLPDVIMRRELSAEKLRGGIGWLRKPIGFVERFLKERLTWLLHRPWLYLPQLLVLALTLFMPFMEVIPTSGSIAAAVIALFAAGLLTRDGGLVALSLVVLLAVPVAVWQFGFSG